MKITNSNEYEIIDNLAETISDDFLNYLHNHHSHLSDEEILNLIPLSMGKILHKFMDIMTENLSGKRDKYVHYTQLVIEEMKPFEIKTH